MTASDARARLLACVGRLPPGCDLTPRVERRERGDGYARELVSYDASPGVRVNAWLLIPDGAARGPAPAVLVLHQHNGEYHLGKSEPVGLAGNPDLAFAHELARRGFVCLAPDMEGFEDRQASAEERARWAAPRAALGLPAAPLEGAAFERFIANYHLLEGSTLQARYLHDAARAVDYLLTLPQVDGRRIGAIGHSLGGQETLWSLLGDRRLRCGVCSCGIAPARTVLRDGINHNLAMYVPGLLDAGDAEALVAAIAPTPLLMTSGARDLIFPIDGVRAIGARAAEAWRAAGAADAFRLRELPGGHEAPAAVREEMYAWLERWLA